MGREGTQWRRVQKEKDLGDEEKGRIGGRERSGEWQREGGGSRGWKGNAQVDLK